MPALFKLLFAGAGTLPLQQSLSNRIRDVLFKQFVVIGIVRPIIALTALASVEKDLALPVPDLAEQRATSRFVARQESMNDLQVRQTGRAHLERLYQGDLQGIMSSW